MKIFWLFLIFSPLFVACQPVAIQPTQTPFIITASPVPSATFTASPVPSLTPAPTRTNIPSPTFDGEAGHRACLNQQVRTVEAIEGLNPSEEAELIAIYSSRACNVFEGLGISFDRLTGAPLHPFFFRHFSLDWGGTVGLPQFQVSSRNGINLNTEWTAAVYRIAPTLSGGVIELSPNTCYLLQMSISGQIKFTNPNVPNTWNDYIYGTRFWFNYGDNNRRQVVEQSIFPQQTTLANNKDFFIISTEQTIAINSGMGDLWVAFDIFSKWAVASSGSYLTLENIAVFPVRASDYCRQGGFVQL